MKDLSKYTSKSKKTKRKSNVVINEATIDDVGPESSDSFIPIARETVVKKKSEKPTTTASQPVEQPASTIYRDLTGRKIDITQVKSTPKSTVVVESEPIKLAPSSFTQSKHDKSYNDFMMSKPLFEDPLRNKTTSSHLEYSKGINLTNRFGIKAGILWDGIDRSNGFEILAMKQNTKAKANEKRVEDYELDYEL